MKYLKLLGAKRHEFGHGFIKRLLASGKVPAVVYGHSGTMALMVHEKELKKRWKEKGHSASLVNVEIKGNTVHLSDIAAIQRDLVTDKFLHADFHEVSQSEKMTIAVLLEFFGEAIGVKQNGGVLYIVRHEVTITSLPADLPSSIRVDVSDLGVGAVMDFSDLVVPGGVEWVGNYASPIVSCNSIAAEEKAKEVVSAEITAAEVVAPKTEQPKIMANSRIIGLGNPGTEYDLIRHNVRFRIVDAFANEKDCAGLWIKGIKLIRLNFSSKTSW